MKTQFSTYYSEELRKDMLELSDRRLLWEVPNGVMECVWNDACDNSLEKLSEHYHTQFYALGRGSRHVCVENTPKNKRNYRHMIKRVKEEQDLLLGILNLIFKQ